MRPSNLKTQSRLQSPPQGRQPLSDVTERTNNRGTTPPRDTSQTIPSSPLLPHHHQSLKPNGLLQNFTPPSMVENKHLSAINRDQKALERDSQVSAVSTNASHSPRPLKRVVGPWLLGKSLGEGSTSRVRQAMHMITGSYAAVKIVSKQMAITQRSQSVREMDMILGIKRGSSGRKPVPFGIDREMVIMKMIEHPNIVKLYDVWENRGELYLFLEYVEGGELFGWINKGPFREAEAVRIFRQILSAVGYCHEFNLCHRDIKPENILLDKNGNVKIVDFGMASLQHTDWLSTSCGSPHYAAPEIALGHKYRGDKADIWSCGVVFYAMLTGTLPFGVKYMARDELRHILEAVVEGSFDIPDHVSDDAQDLLLRMLQRHPDDRIDIADIWDHPILVQYQHFVRHSDDSPSWFGGPAPIMTSSDCGEAIIRREDIDKDLLDGLCVLWYSADEEELVEELLSPEPNHIKVIYQNLKKSRIEQEENYIAPSMPSSRSDYHHLGRPLMKKSATLVSLSGQGQRRNVSNYSIALDSVKPSPTQSPRYKGEGPSETGTDKSYDPFRESRQKIAHVEADHAKVTLLPRSSVASKNTRNSSLGTFVRHPAVARLQDDEALSFSNSAPRFPVDAHGNIRELRRKTIPLVYSRSSMTSSQHSRASSKAFRSSMSYKRNIRFDHSNRSSSARRSSPPPRPAAPTPLNLQQRYIHDRDSNPLHSSSSFDGTPKFDHSANQAIRSRKEGVSVGPTLSKRSSGLWEEKTRQVSKELSFFCDQAFNKGLPISDSTVQNRADDSRLTASPYPPSTPSAPSHHRSGVGSNALRYQSRPLPKPPVNEAMATNTHLELSKAKEKLLQRARLLERGELDEILGHIDRLIEANSKHLDQLESEKRVTSAPAANSGRSNWLSPVKEETEKVRKRNGRSSRHASEPVNNEVQSPGPEKTTWERDSTTVRHVDAAETGDMPAPLVVRKKNSAFTLRPVHRLKPQKSQDSFLGSRVNMENDVRNLPWTDTQGHGRSSGRGLLDFKLEAIGEDGDANHYEPTGVKRSSGENKMKNWFRRSSSSHKTSESERGPIPPLKDDWLTQGDVFTTERPRTMNHSDTTSGDIPMRELKGEKPSGTSKFLSMFSKKKSRARKPSEMAVLGNDQDDDESYAPSSTVSQSPHTNGAIPNRNRNRSAVSVASGRHTRFGELPPSKTVQVPTQNWFARFLHVKPGKKVLALQISKVRAMKEIRAILRDWRQFGMRGIVTDREAGWIRAKVDEKNSLHIKPVDIVVETFTVMFKGRKAGLSMAKFSQEKGAKSSFEKVVAQMEEVLKGKKMLVEEKKQVREMKKVLAAWESA